MEVLYGSTFVARPDLIFSTRNTRSKLLIKSKKSKKIQASDSGSTTTTTTTTGCPFTDGRSTSSSTEKKKVVRDIPGTYGLPILGSLIDRHEYFYARPGIAFFEKRIKEYGSTVFRTNMPPGPPFFPSSKVIAVLDQVSFATLFDLSKVSKKDLFTGTYMPSTSFTGGYRVLAYLDVEEPKHAQLKSFCMDMLRSNGKKWLPELHSACSVAFDKWEVQPLRTLTDLLCLEFLCKSILDMEPEVTPDDIKPWLLPQIAPVATGILPFELPNMVEDLLLHTFPLPFGLVQKKYDMIVSFFRRGTRVLELAASHGIGTEEAVHNLVFNVCFNTWGGFIGLLPTLTAFIAADPKLQAEIRAEVRQAVPPSETPSMESLQAMPVLKSTVYEVLRFCPPVKHQYARARKDFILESHDEAFQVKRGEVLYGFQQLVTQDPRVFEAPKEFRPKRFISAEAQEQLLPYVLWSNGPETQQPSTSNKQCAGKDFVVLIARAFIAELFLKYDSMELIHKDSVRFHKRT